ncbi:MAG: exodeoxyribonuclease VII large subunit [Elusimicrobia bacterium]|nr:exodeoxyribonuclease VII large subunit [Elusimicrobiota bacterium]
MNPENKILSVSELNKTIKYLLEETIGEVWIEGEISGFKISSLGHVYFDLKDSQSIISCVMYKGFAAYLRFKPENGLLVKVRALVTTYAKQSKYQLNIKEIIPGNIGPLQIAFEQLKKKLREEGLFDEARKKPLPKLPKKIALVTSLHGAAIRDMLSILKRRYSNLHIIIAPVKVQGDGAKEEIAAAIKTLNENFPDIDAMLVGRGGGSMEDLWAFNEEIVARAIASSKICVISCIGHETDFTIADFVSDLRAPTPSAAAELVVENKEELKKYLKQLDRRLVQSLKILYENLKGKFLRLAGNRIFKNPQTLLNNLIQRFDGLNEDMIRAADYKIKDISDNLKFKVEKLHALSPLFPLKKGYSLVRKTSDNSVVKNSCDLEKEELLSIKFKAGKAEVKVTNTTA